MTNFMHRPYVDDAWFSRHLRSFFAVIAAKVTTVEYVLECNRFIEYPEQIV
jgi:hypothetical protein